MKKIFVLALFALLSLPQISSAQIEKGGKIIGLNGLYARSNPKGYSNNESITQSNGNLTAYQLHLVNDGFAIGYFVDFRGNAYKNKNSSTGTDIFYKTNVNSINLGPSFRYFSSIGKSTYFYPELSLGVGRNWTGYEQRNNSNTTKESSGSTNLLGEFSLGIAHFFGPNVAIDGKIGYGRAGILNSNGNTGLGALGAQIGLLVFLKKKSE
ncbi:hypothetical protein [Aquiflexum sp.]|uniref:hypothetical protein n=1 Tax=Aquiflexum sp. TaxID=1872584 RepID=UPI0035943290